MGSDMVVMRCAPRPALDCFICCLGPELRDRSHCPRWL